MDNKIAGHTQEATQQLTKLMGSKTIFDFSKPVRLIQKMLQIASDKDSSIHDLAELLLANEANSY